ncbi:MAG: hypothetical protein ACLUB2_05470 [Butyricicoccus pullicaecorum]
MHAIRNGTLLLNLIGSIIFLTAVYAFQYTVGFSFWSEAIDKAGIANFHTLFNVVVTLIFLPFTRVLVFLPSTPSRHRRRRQTRWQSWSLACWERLPSHSIRHSTASQTWVPQR